MPCRRLLLSFALLAVCTTAGTAADDEFFDSNGVKIHYVSEGEGEPIVLIHGFTSSIQNQWAMPGIFAALAKEHRVIALDNRGHGRSGKPHEPEKYGVEMVEDVLRLLDRVGVHQAHFVGYSMGGFITNYLMATHPERVITATLGGAGWRKPDDTRFDITDALAESLDAGRGIGPLIELLTPAGRKPDPGEVMLLNQMVIMSNDSKALAACVRGMTTLTVTEEQLKKSKTPALALIGESDPMKLGVDEMAVVKPNFQVEVITGADHITAYSQAKFVDDLQQFISKHSQKQPAEAVTR